MASIEQRRTRDGKIRYRALVRLRGAPAQSATFRSKTRARRWAQQTEAAIREGRHFRSAEAKKHTLADLVERYKKSVLARRPGRHGGDPERLLGWWRDRLGEYLLADVTPALIAEQRDHLAEGRTYKGTPRAAATVNRYLGVLSHAITVATREWGWVDDNPVRKVNRLKEPRGRVRFLSEDEKRRLLEACRARSNSRLYPLVVLAVSTGARQGELLALRWPDVDLDRGLAVIHDTKNGERRALPIAGLASSVLRDLRRVRRIDTNRVFADRRGRTGFPRKAWELALESAEIEDFRFHDLRHTAASYLAMSGATLAEIAEVLGHKTLAMVKRYSHLTDQHTSKVVARMNERFIGGG